MKRCKKKTVPFIALALCTLMGLCAMPAASEAKKPGGGGGADYSVVVLAPPNVDIRTSYANDLDESGNVVGWCENSADERRGFYYNSAQKTYLVFAPGIRAFGLNNLGEMVGIDDNTGEGLYWRSPNDQNPITLSPLLGDQISVGHKINDAGIIIGTSHADGFSATVAWKVNSQGIVSDPILLPFPNGDVRGSPTDLTELDNDGMCHVVGYSGLDDLYETALQWDLLVDDNGALGLASGPIDIGSLGGDPSAAFGVNADGDIVGKSGVWPFVKPSGQAVQPLPGIRKATWGYAEGINDAGTMVGVMGYLFHGTPIEKAVLWSDPTTVVDLNKKVELGRSEVLEFAFRINYSGAILAWGVFPGITGSGNAACLLVPTH